MSLYIYKDLRLKTEDLRLGILGLMSDHYHGDENLMSSPWCGFGFGAAFQL